MPAAPIHRERELEELVKASIFPVVTESHASHDVGELLKVHPLRGEQGASLEEGEDAFEEVRAITNHEDQRPIALAVRLDVATPKPRADQLENLSPIAVLADMELWNELKPDAAGAIALHRDREAAFSVDVPCDVAIQPFLLIVRTRHVLTIVGAWSDDTMSSAGFSEFPAFSQI